MKESVLVEIAVANQALKVAGYQLSTRTASELVPRSGAFGIASEIRTPSPGLKHPLFRIVRPIKPRRA